MSIVSLHATAPRTCEATYYNSHDSSLLTWVGRTTIRTIYTMDKHQHEQAVIPPPVMASPSQPASLNELLAYFQTHHPVSLLPKASSKTHLPAAKIARLALHPCLEALLHILNNDLSSAHFLVRHMQSPPAWEGMLLHAVLHRIEGDYANAEAWYDDVAESEVLIYVWGDDMLEGSSRERARQFVTCCRELAKRPALHQTEIREENEPELRRQRVELQQQADREVQRLLDWCVRRFGSQEYLDASDAWVQDQGKIKEVKDSQLVGGEGWRSF